MSVSRYATRRRQSPLGVLVTIVITIGMHLVLPSLYRFFGAEGEVLAGGLRYMRVIASGGLILVLSSGPDAGLVARGDTKAFRNVLMIAALLNVASIRCSCSVCG